MMDQAQAGAFVTAAEMRMKSAWLDEHVLGARLPFSFIYGERHSSDLLASWTRASHTEQLPGGRVEHVLVWTEPVSRLEVRCVAVDYPDFPVIEWTVTLKNSGSENTPILEEIQALEVDFTRSAGGIPRLKR